MADGVSKCGRKSALAVFFSVSLFAFLICLLSLLSPSWQYAYLENGRTEHHHGLWLDCKRDYSFDYGRTREYYETLYRRDLQGSPFEMFFLPPLQCVYKFDYYIDPEDLYDHDHDENRLQNDAYQHLFLGWKVAALAAVGVSVSFSASSILLGICSFCHRTFICACTVLSTIAAILSTVGVIVFYIWANYQDNKVIKEEDEDLSYEQSLGWAFYFQVFGACLHWLSSMLGCCVTSIALSKSRAKLVKIEVVEGDESIPLSGASQSSQPFKRSFSAIYRVDSQALRQWERDYLKNTQRRGSGVEEHQFQRTASVPNFSKKQRKQERKRQRQMGRSQQDLMTSTSNITETTRTGSNLTLNTHRTSLLTQGAAPEPSGAPAASESPPRLKSALKTPQSSRRTLMEDSMDPSYEYLACPPSSMGVSSFGATLPRGHDYDSVYEQIGPEAYLEPNRVREAREQMGEKKGAEGTRKALLPSLPANHGSSQSIPTAQQKTTVIDDVVRPSSSNDVRSDLLKKNEALRIRERLTIEEMTRMERFRRNKQNQQPEVLPKPILKPSVPPKSSKPAMNIRDFGIDLSKQMNGYCTEISKREVPTGGHVEYSGNKEFIGTSTGNSPWKNSQMTSEKRLSQLSGRLLPESGNSRERRESGEFESAEDLPPPPNGVVAINTFGMGTRSSNRSITNLSFRPPLSSDAAVTDIFHRPESVASQRNDRKTPTNLHRSLMKIMPEEVDRSVGSSTVFENDTLSEAGSYAREAAVRLNLFLDDKKSNQDETTV